MNKKIIIPTIVIVLLTIAAIIYFAYQHQTSPTAHNIEQQYIEGTWTDIEDPLAHIDVSGSTWKFLYEGEEMTDAETYRVEFKTAADVDGKDTDATYLSLSNASDTILYEIISLEPHSMQLLYLPQGVMHTYTK